MVRPLLPHDKKKYSSVRIIIERMKKHVHTNQNLKKYVIKLTDKAEKSQERT